MQYRCKVLKPSFYLVFKAFLEVHEKDESHRRIFQKAIHDAWNLPGELEHKAFLAKIPELFRSPDYTMELFIPMETNCQVKPRIEWKGFITKIDEVDEIIGFDVINADSPVALKEC